MTHRTRAWTSLPATEVLANNPERLTEAERKVIHVLTVGYTYRETAEELGISFGVLEQLMVSIIEKLGPPSDGGARVREPRTPHPSADGGMADPP